MVVHPESKQTGLLCYVNRNMFATGYTYKRTYTRIIKGVHTIMCDIISFYVEVTIIPCLISICVCTRCGALLS